MCNLKKKVVQYTEGLRDDFKTAQMQINVGLKNMHNRQLIIV